MIETQDLRGLLTRISVDLQKITESLNDSADAKTTFDDFRNILDGLKTSEEESPTPTTQAAGNETSTPSGTGKEFPVDTTTPARTIETYWTEKRAEMRQKFGMSPPLNARDPETGHTYRQISKLARKENFRNQASPAAAAQMDFSAFFSKNPVGHSESFAGGTLTLVSSQQATYKDPNGNEHIYNRSDPVLQIARDNPFIAAEWEQKYSLKPLESPVDRYFMDGSAFIPNALATVEGTGQFNRGNREILKYSLPNGVVQFIDPESSLGRVQPNGLIGHALADTVFQASGGNTSFSSYGHARFMEEIGNQAVAVHQTNPNTSRNTGVQSVEELA